MAGTVRGSQLARLLGGWQGAGRAGGPEYARLAAAVRGLLTDGRLALGVRLPAERELAQALGLSRTTVTAAYRTLRESGHLTSRRGAGSWTALPSGHRVGTSGLWGPIEDDDTIDLGQAALPAPPELTAAVAAAAEDLPPYLTGAGYHPMGLAVLREAVAREYTERGLPTLPDQIMITAGVSHALDLVLRLLVAPGQRVLLEAPTYPNALTAVVASRARVIGYALGDAGWDSDLLLSTVRDARARLAYLIPDFHNPTGHLMETALRERLPAAAHAVGTDVVVDESFADLRLDGPELPPAVATFDRAARVLTIGGMSKPYWGGLRIGWVRAATSVTARLAAARVAVDMSSPVLDQLVGAHLLGARQQVVAARRAELTARRDTLVAALRAHLPEWRFVVPHGGLSLWVELDAPVSSALARAVEELGVRVAAGPRFGADGTMERFLRLPYTLPEADLVEAVRRLAQARESLDRVPVRQLRAPAIVA
ncbi:PLP-dependent aminotransferase family protein [Planosporangium flavigriseum]|uniref:GntR family transcriptional regulator n=1 Tax=Planosporangium flavigriseum TaxID=373681 RepID=A0A8J3LRR7_9ACTN|nr:PLP-dependent aminotransferase family protein [Planosporangium flavigriseum]NJC63184.1 PLP-dependent aminotransferase family protein [Planosporangium flavigriseum]GIG72456.1 GntR family transcriptional regulator [Planosporangium flavigriseum]